MAACPGIWLDQSFVEKLSEVLLWFKKYDPFSGRKIYVRLLLFHTHNTHTLNLPNTLLFDSLSEWIFLLSIIHNPDTLDMYQGAET